MCRSLLAVLGGLGAALLVACGGGGGASTANVPGTVPLSAQAALGEEIFADVSLSASGRQACASCHHPDNAHSSANHRATQLGGAPRKVVPAERRRHHHAPLP